MLGTKSQEKVVKVKTPAVILKPVKDVFQNAKINLRREIIFTRIGLAATFVATAFSFQWILQLATKDAHNGQWHAVAAQAVFGLIIFFFVYGNVLYQLTRIGYFQRLLKHVPASWKQLDRFFSGKAPTLTVLIPSYKEELRVVKQSILSSALQEYPNKRVVLLVDDPTHPKNPQDLESLEAVRKLPVQLEKVLHAQRNNLAAHRREFQERVAQNGFNPFAETIYLCGTYADLAWWYVQQCRSTEVVDHADDLFIEKVFLDPAAHYDRLADGLAAIAMNGVGYPRQEDVDLAYQKLESKFNVEITSFERKRYENLSHEPNKAMNLNSYIGLLGRSFKQVRRAGKIFLEESSRDEATFHVPVSDFLITLDADSILNFDYAIRLIDLMLQPGNECIAVAQTPYSAVPNAPGLVERIAGATTDMQYLIHQGFTKYDATYWVGANALLRVKALADIREELVERGYKVYMFIQDRTVIEDTESSVDLVVKGWKLYNYPERMSYSATPPDFGSLLIQRRRWANGGLIIFPKLWRYIVSEGVWFKKFGQVFMRVHYLISIAAVNLGLPIMMLYSFDKNLNNVWLPLTAIPYYFFYGRDMIHAGYRLSDLFRVYAMNLLLIPVNLGGVFKSIEQGITKQRIPFKRTPKISGRTTSPAGYIVMELIILANFGIGVVFDLSSQRYSQAICGLINGAFFYYAVSRFIGFKEAFEDIYAAFKNEKSKRAVDPGRCRCSECLLENISAQHVASAAPATA